MSIIASFIYEMIQNNTLKDILLLYIFWLFRPTNVAIQCIIQTTFFLSKYRIYWSMNNGLITERWFMDNKLKIEERLDIGSEYKWCNNCWYYQILEGMNVAFLVIHFLYSFISIYIVSPSFCMAIDVLMFLS